MNHFKQIAAALEAHRLDAILLTCEANRFYASGFHSSGTDGIALVTRDHNYYFTDSRYIEAAENNLPGFTVRMTHPGSSDIERINELARKAKTVGLTPEENEERAKLRRAYIDSVVGDLRQQLDNTYIVDAKGNKRKLRQ